MANPGAAPFFDELSASAARASAKLATTTKRVLALTDAIVTTGEESTKASARIAAAADSTLAAMEEIKKCAGIFGP
jgi:hypothetical protein